ncbi:hypothetical protein M8997_006055 [Phyllobacterium sp. 21LDTY02-6]|uniref:hypothetical protein n=1 Tax=unclassified Phyllobacterium TaxID=2638441 RepID=UPI0020223BFE|nr:MULTISPECIES: hypothetical protein [unclassified Phyllobacterium]MCO4316740.1 hypothetical protein [Phyllobacterium sp. 21LDTY02-6]MCX8281687.1 hypothetical protein [Phyllobacterium sp. 0TCS1.6C]MCX8294797.1 hypothetical protein [Phyllobacterium sp. 0TCS1.6A]
MRFTKDTRTTIIFLAAGLMAATLVMLSDGPLARTNLLHAPHAPHSASLQK